MESPDYVISHLSLISSVNLCQTHAESNWIQHWRNCRGGSLDTFIPSQNNETGLDDICLNCTCRAVQYNTVGAFERIHKLHLHTSTDTRFSLDKARITSL